MMPTLPRRVGEARGRRRVDQLPGRVLPRMVGGVMATGRRENGGGATEVVSGAEAVTEAGGRRLRVAVDVRVAAGLPQEADQDQEVEEDRDEGC